MSTAGKYEAGFNFMRLQNPYSPTPGVPVNMNNLWNLTNHNFKTPCTFDGVLRVPLGGPTEDPLKMTGALKCINPEEHRYSLLLAIKRDITTGKEDKVLQEWKVVLLTTTVHFCDGKR